MDSDFTVEARVAALERRLFWFQVAFGTAVAALGLVTIWSAVLQARDGKDVRARSLVIEDAAGRDRIVLGAPMRDPQGRVSPSTGLKINDQNGAERFAVGLLDDSRVVMGLDAPPGTGDPRNRERITLVADAKGGAYIRFLNRKTGVPGRLTLADDDRLYLEFVDSREGKTVIKRIGFSGEQFIEAK